MEIRLGIERCIPLSLSEERTGIHLLTHPLEVLFVVSLEKNFSILGQGSMKYGDETVLYQSVLVVFFLGPRVGKEVMQTMDAAGRNHPFEEVPTFNPQSSHVAQPATLAFAAHLADATEQALHPQKPGVRVVLCHRQQEPAVPAAQVNLAGRRAIRSEHLGNRVTSEVIFRYERCLHLA